MIQVVCGFLDVHPERMHLHALDLVLLALHRSFPICSPDDQDWGIHVQKATKAEWLLGIEEKPTKTA
jgi:hypothetical protein